MDRIRIEGGRPLQGVVPIGGAKNAALPLMAAALLTEDTLILDNMPRLADITTLQHLLIEHGAAITMQGQRVALTAREITSTLAPYDLVRKMRASVLVLGPLLARAREARVSLPGGCAIGTRPVDLHLMGLTRLGAEVRLEQGYIVASVPHGLKGAEIVFPIVSVGATENLMMAASLAQGETVLVNAAREPEIVDLAACLQAMGAKISGAGTDRITIHGVEKLHGARHRVLPDRIETGTYLMAAAIAGGRLRLAPTRYDTVAAVAKVLERAGVAITDEGSALIVEADPGRLQGVDVMTEPFPGFPTDLQAQIMAVMTRVQGAAMITETIFENRFMHVPELCRLGANINVHGASAVIRGVKALAGAEVMATDLRASVSLV
ncbi:MAG TPA: UDP-N-acetylglucosamine 1-carboxyvinyltransferase, partial [Stellaceae bacterium]|nr:UDP-N-acetylglucosamine 1-carboxyvinyltransferase [Stellaceae bacterium]